MDDEEIVQVFVQQERPFRAEEINWEKGVFIPAGEEGRKPVKILPKPHYIKISHGFRVWDFKDTGFNNPRTPDNYYAIYMFGVFNDETSNKPDQIRFLRFPVVNDDSDVSGVDQKIFEELSQQTGEEESQLRRSAKPRDIQAIVRNTAHRIHRSLRWIMDPRTNMQTNGINGDCLRDDPNKSATIYSGWKDGKDLFQPNTNFVAIARAPGGADWYVDISCHDEIGNRETTGYMISPPLPDDLSGLSEEDKRLINGLISANK
ncbi:hypothetical protein IPM62_01550 [Candidatus Woesebacteria bacterium]|nr:MAG: hypothetical protein IPM62_01550 [Candidatus Woesebacteria bacterium]